MKILVVDHNSQERTLTTNALAAEKHDVEVAKDAASAHSVFDSRAPEVVLVEWTAPGSAAFVKHVRANESAAHVFVVATSSRPSPSDMKLALQSGVDDFVRKPIPRDELLLRIDGMSRIRQWVARLYAGGVSIDLSVAPDVSLSRAWLGVDSAICADVKDMIGMDLVASNENDVFKGAVLGAELPLTLASDGVEVRVAVALDTSSSQTLAGALFDDKNADAALINDMLREIANVAAGSFKRTAAAEGRVFTTGLPVDALPATFHHATAKARRQWVARSPETGAVLRFEVDLRVNEKKRVCVKKLEEGMVVAHDILNDAGALFMRGGTRITETHIAHLPRILGESAYVLVA